MGSSAKAGDARPKANPSTVTNTTILCIVFLLSCLFVAIPLAALASESSMATGFARNSRTHCRARTGGPPNYDDYGCHSFSDNNVLDTTVASEGTSIGVRARYRR